MRKIQLDGDFFDRLFCDGKSRSLTVQGSVCCGSSLDTLAQEEEAQTKA